jgi:serine/threonine-protein kinase
MAQPLPIVGVQIPGYEILSQLGAGGMGVVFKALDLNLQRTVALKFLTHINDGAAAEKERLLREARAASALDHPNIAAVYTVQETSDGRLCMVMAYYGGETLADKLRSGPLQTAKTIALARQIAAGLAHAHEHGIVHRDIKPSNVIVTDDGVAKILDFGLARLTASSASTQTGMSGTLPYMSPEQVEGKVVDERTDIWAFGVLLYQSLTARLPFAADSAVATVMAISSASPAPMPEVSDDLQVIIYRCLCKARDARYASCTKLLKDLESLQPVSSDAPTAKLEAHERMAELRRASASAAGPVIATPRWRPWAAPAITLALILTAALLGLRWHNASSSASPMAADIAPAAHESYLKGLGYLERYDKPGNLDSAITLFEASVKSDSSFALGFSALGEAFWDKYRLSQDPRWVDKAEEYCKRAAELNSQLPAVYVTLGRVHNGKGQRNLALEELQHALKLEPGSADALLGLAGVYDGMGRTQEAEDAYKKAAALRPDHLDGHYELAVFYYRHQRYSDAAEQFRRVIELAPDHAPAHSNLGVMLRNLGNIAEAEKEFNKSIQLNPTYSAYANIAFLYYSQKRWAESAQMTRKALDLNAADYRLWGNLGLAYEWLNQGKDAEEAYRQELTRLEQTVKLRPEDPNVQCELAVLFSKLRLRGKAIDHVEAALARAPEDPHILADAAETYENLADRARALQLTQQALAKGWTIDQLESNPDLRGLLADPRFRRMSARAAVPAQQH